MATCRKCGQWMRGDESVKYGVRHYAHFACYLDMGKRLEDLHNWQIGEFPWRLLKDRGLLPVAMERIGSKDGVTFKAA